MIGGSSVSVNVDGWTWRIGDQVSFQLHMGDQRRHQGTILAWSDRADRFLVELAAGPLVAAGRHWIEPRFLKACRVEIEWTTNGGNPFAGPPNEKDWRAITLRILGPKGRARFAVGNRRRNGLDEWAVAFAESQTAEGVENREERLKVALRAVNLPVAD